MDGNAPTDNFIGPPRAVIPDLGVCCDSSFPQFERESLECDVEGRPLSPRALWVLPKPLLDGDGNLVQLGDGGGENQEQAQHLWRLGLQAKAHRLASCGRFGQRVECENGHSYYQGFRCGQRFCRRCAPSLAAELFELHADLEKFCKRRQGWVIALLDFTVKNTGRLPDAKFSRAVNCAVRRLMHKLLRGVKGWGYLWVDELGFDGTNLHVHGIYYGPYLDQRVISQAWLKETGDSFIVYIQKARRGFRPALWHHLKYVNKPPSNDPRRLAELEVAFHGVRRVHTLGVFYNPETDGEEKEVSKESCRCPRCRSPLSPVGCYCPITQLEADGLRDVDEVRRELSRRKAFSGSGPP